MPSGHPPTPNSIIVGNCIECSGLVRVSTTTSATASVRCPHCQQTFPLASLLEMAVPEVEVMEPQAVPVKKEKQKLYIDQTTETVKDAAGRFVVPSQLAKGARRRKSSRRSGSSRSRSSSSETDRSSRGNDSPSRDDNRSLAQRNGDPKTQNQRVSDRADDTRRKPHPSENGSRSAAPRSKNYDAGGESYSRKQESQPTKSYDGSKQSYGSHRSTRHRDARMAEELNSKPQPVLDILKIVGGAGLALPIAYMVVLWVFARDPLGVGENLGKNLPFLVPTTFRTKTEPDADSTPSATNQGFQDFQDFTDDGQNIFDSFDIGGEALKGLHP